MIRHLTGTSSTSRTTFQKPNKERAKAPNFSKAAQLVCYALFSVGLGRRTPGPANLCDEAWFSTPGAGFNGRVNGFMRVDSARPVADQ